jgi:hypothetical protein
LKTIEHTAPKKYSNNWDFNLYKLQELQSRSSSSHINLSKEAIEILKKAKYCSHIKPITAIGENGVWDLTLVNKRNERILNILWQRINKWLF